MGSHAELVYPPSRCPSCHGLWDSTKHQMMCVAPTVIDPRDADIISLKLQVEKLLGESKEDFIKTEEQLKALTLQVDALREALTTIDAMRKRLPDSDCGEQTTTAKGIAEVVRAALTKQQNDPPMDLRETVDGME